MNKKEMGMGMPASAKEEFSPEEIKKQARDVRRSLTMFFEKEFADLGAVLAHRMKKSVVDGDFGPVYELTEMLKRETDKMKGEYENYWKDLGPDQ
ncbi:MAG: hypothetical protein V1804_04610 [Patescibacteria group bacterium]